MLDPDEIKSRYALTHVATDKFGRAITIGRLKPSQQARVADIAGPNTGDVFRIVACVRKIDDDNIPFPKSRGELEALMDRLEQEGLEAVTDCMVEMAKGEAGTTKTVEAAKN